MLRVYREYERRKAERGEIDFEDLLELAVRLLRRRRRVRWRCSRTGTARSPSTSTRTSTCSSRRCSTAGSATVRRPLRRRRRLPVDLRLHRRLASLAARLRRPAFPRRRSFGSRTTTARRPRCSSSRTGSSRGSAEPRRCCAPTLGDGPRAGRARLLRRPSAENGWLVGELTRLAARGTALRGDRGPVPDERAACRLRRSPARGRACRSRARRCSSGRRRAGCCGCSRVSSRRMFRAASGHSPRRPGCSRRSPRSSASASSSARPTWHASSASQRSSTTAS